MRDQVSIPDIPTLTQEEEVQLAQAREQAELRMVQHILRSSEASDELGAIGRDLAAGRVSLADVVRAHLGDEDVDDFAERRLAELLVRAGRRPSAKKQQAALLEMLAQYRWSPKTVDRIVARLTSPSRHKRPADGPRSAVGLIRKAFGEAEDARQALIHANLRLVVWIARRKTDHGLALGDLVQEGNIGLMRAADKFDHRRGVRFSTYATWWIRQSVNRALSDQSRTIRLPVHLLEVKHKLDGVRRRFVGRHGREATPEELAETMGIALSRVRQVLEAPKQPLSMEAPLDSDGDGRLGDGVADPTTVSPVDRLAEDSVRDAIHKMLTRLSPREQLVLKMRFGIDHPDGITLQEVGKKLSVSRERIRQIESQALLKLRQEAEPYELSSYLSA